MSKIVQSVFWIVKWNGYDWACMHRMSMNGMGNSVYSNWAWYLGCCVERDMTCDVSCLLSSDWDITIIGLYMCFMYILGAVNRKAAAVLSGAKADIKGNRFVGSFTGGLSIYYFVICSVY